MRFRNGDILVDAYGQEVIFMFYFPEDSDCMDCAVAGGFGKACSALLWPRDGRRVLTEECRATERQAFEYERLRGWHRLMDDINAMGAAGGNVNVDWALYRLLGIQGDGIQER